MQKVRNVLAIIGGITLLLLLLLLITGGMDHLFRPWNEPNPGIHYKLVKYSNGKSIGFTIDRRIDEAWRIHLPCTNLPGRKEVRTTWPNKTDEEVILCNGRTVIRSRSLLWHWWFIWIPKGNPIQIPQSHTPPTHKA